jgi:hypothetical protein
MKASHKAALLSAFVFPGAGHLYLKRYSRALVIMFPVFTGAGYIIWSITVSALQRLEGAITRARSGVPDLQELSDIVGLKTLTTGPCQDVLFYGIVCIWIFAIIDAYRIGKRRELKDEETSPL